MRTMCVLLLVVCLASCVHTAIAPVADPNGVPVVVRVPGAKVGKKATPEQIAAIDRKVEQEVVGKTEEGKPDPAIISIGPVGFYGDMTTKSGEKFVGYVPLIMIRSTYPADVVDRVAGRIAVAYYRAAKKHYKVIPVTDLKNRPEKQKP